MTADDGEAYVLGHTQHELSRLEQQGALFDAETRDVYRRAGLSSGMRVLNVGCGAGDDALIAAELVGSTGSVLGIDRSASALALAAARAERHAFSWLRFREADIYSFEPDTRFDAVIGRFILLHVGDAIGAVKRLATFAPAGVLAFVEMDINQAGAIPPLPLLSQCIDWIVRTYRGAGVEPNMGSALYATFRAAGLVPQLNGTCRIVSGPDAVAYPFTAQTIASLIPTMEKLGVATAAEIGIDTLAERLRRDAVAGDHCILLPRLVGAWAKVPA